MRCAHASARSPTSIACGPPAWESRASIASGLDQRVELSIVMPCLNEAATVGDCVKQAREALAKYAINGEVIVADNGSTDGSRELAAAAGARVVPVPMRGYGSALLTGIASARGEFVVMGDADGSYNFMAIDVFLARLREGYDLVMGNRFKGGVAEGAMPFLHRYLGNPVLSFLGRLFFSSEVGDFHSGLRGFRRSPILALDLRTTGMEFASEMVVKASVEGLRIAEVPVTLSPDKRNRPPHLRTWRDGWRHLRFLLLYSPRWLFLFPGALLMVVGALVLLWLLPGERAIGSLRLDIHTLVYAAAAVVLGYQAVIFALFTKTFAISEGLLPEDPRLTRLYRYVTLETGIVAGIVLVIAGLVLAATAIGIWQTQGFGPIVDVPRSLRVVILSSLAITLGVQTFFASFFLSVLGLSRR
ncbi:MAG: glycosyltransferase family 2 protein [Chloroflexi bacterium]|nr:MAG: glycosyltransferase family 2 protein [Chloroflexota bacterium]